MHSLALSPACVGDIARGALDTKSIDAATAEAMVRHHLAMAATALIPAGTKLTPEERLLAAAHRDKLLQMMAVVAVSQRVSGLLDAQGVRHLWLKGPALAVQTTGRWDTRGSCDVDVLIDPADCAAAHAAFTGVGLRRRDARSGPAGRFVRWAICEAGYNGTLANIDLHWRLDPSPSVYSTPFEELWQRSESLEVQGTQARTLGRLDAWMFTAVHGARSDWVRWSMLLDAVRQAMRLTPMQQLAARELAQAAGCAVPLAIAEALVERCLPGSIAHSPERWRLERADEILTSTAAGAGSKLSLRASLARRLELARAGPGLGSLAGSLSRAVGRVMLNPGHYRGHLLASLGLGR